MRRIVSLILAMAMLFTGFSISVAADTANISTSGATSGKCGKNVTWSYKNGTFTISGSGAMYNYEAYKPWDSLYGKIKKVVIKNGVTTVGACAFWQEDNLKQVTIPKSVKTIGDGAFSSTPLTSVTIPASVKTIGYEAFRGANTTSLTIPDNVQVGVAAFRDLSCLKTLTVGKNVDIQKWAFGGCYNLRSIYFKGKVKISSYYSELDGGTFSSVNANVYFPPSWTKVPSSTAYDAEKFTYILNAQTSLTGLSLSTGGVRKAKPSWKKISGVTGYEIQMSRSSSFSSPTKKIVKGTSAIFNVSKGKKYYFRVRTYKTIGGKKYYSKWSAVRHKTI